MPKKTLPTDTPMTCSAKQRVPQPMRSVISSRMSTPSRRLANRSKGPIEGPGVSVKLSALHPRFEIAQRQRALEELLPRLLHLAGLARDGDVGFTVDAEEAERLELSLELFEAASASPVLRGWDGFGLAVQAYQKRALPVVNWLADLAKRHKRRIMLRLVKGAYWDTEIKPCPGAGASRLPGFHPESGHGCFFPCLR